MVKRAREKKSLAIQKVIILSCILCLIMPGVSAAEVAVIGRPSSLQLAQPSPSFISCSLPYECLTKVAAQDKWPGGFIQNGSSACGYARDNSAQYCYRSNGRMVAGPASGFVRITTAVTVQNITILETGLISKLPEAEGKDVDRLISKLPEAERKDAEKAKNELEEKQKADSSNQSKVVREIYNPCLVEGQINCSGECVDLMTNASHCGTCGMVCPTDATGSRICKDGNCFSCPLEQIYFQGDCVDGEAAQKLEEAKKECKKYNLLFCMGGCVNPDTDPHNCGTCSISCGSDESCRDGKCVKRDLTQVQEINLQNLMDKTQQFIQTLGNIISGSNNTKKDMVSNLSD